MSLDPCDLSIGATSTEGVVVGVGDVSGASSLLVGSVIETVGVCSISTVLVLGMGGVGLGVR